MYYDKILSQCILNDFFQIYQNYFQKAYIFKAKIINYTERFFIFYIHCTNLNSFTDNTKCFVSKILSANRLQILQ